MPISHDKIRQLRQKRKKLAEEAREILERAEDGAMSAEDEARFNKIHDDIEELRGQIEREERQLDAESELEAREEVRTGPTTEGPEGEERSDEYRKAFRQWLRGGTGQLSQEERQLLQSRAENLTPEQRALGTISDTAGGYLIPEEFANQIEKAMKAFGGVRESGATILRSSSGADLPMPTTNDTSNKGTRIGENTQIGEQDPTYGRKVLKAYMYTSKIVRVPLQLMQDSAFDIESHLAGLLGERIARILNEEFTIYSGANGPEGFITGAALGKTAASATAITYDELVDLEHSVDPAYRNRPGTRLTFHDTTLRDLKKLKDADDRPLWLPGVALREPDTLLGYRYTINQDMPEIATGNKSIAFGDFGKYMIRDVRSIQLVQFREKYMDYLQVGFMAFSRHDGALLDAGTNPIKYLQQA